CGWAGGARGAPGATTRPRAPFYNSGSFAAPVVEPQQGRHGLRVGELAVADHGERLVEGPDQGLQELALVELALGAREAPREVEVDRLVGVRDRGVNHAEIAPVRRGVAGLLGQLALRGGEVRLARLELARPGPRGLP